MLIRNRILSREAIASMNLSVDPPPANSFFFRAFNKNMTLANSALHTNFIQGIANGNLHPVHFGALNVLDVYYCINAQNSIIFARNNTKEQDLFDMLNHMNDGYTKYNNYFLDTWHFRNESCVAPTKAIQGYVTHESNVAHNLHSIYTLTALLPCYYLWYWLSDQIYNRRETNLYRFWIEGSHSANTAYAIGNFIDNWQKSGRAFDEELATNIYTASMQFENSMFTEATPPLEFLRFLDMADKAIPAFNMTATNTPNTYWIE